MAAMLPAIKIWGPTLRTITCLTAAFSVAAPFGAAMATPPGSAEEVRAFQIPMAAVVALVDVTVIDGLGGPVRANQTLIIKGGRIADLGPMGTVQIPAGAEQRRLTGHSVLPGLVMLHEHMQYFSGFRIWHSQAVSFPRLYLAAGVTTVRTAGGDMPQTDLNLKLAIDEGRIAGPHMFVTGPFFNGYSDHFLGDDIVRDAAEGRREVQYWAGHGATSFKIYADLTPDAARGVIEAAHALHLPVTGHLGRIGCLEAAQLGIDNIEHSFTQCLPELGVGDTPDPARAATLIRTLIAHRVVLTSTPAAERDTPMSSEERALLHPTALATYDAWFARPHPELGAPRDTVRKLERAFIAAGGRMVIGSDAQDAGQIAGFADDQALEALVAAGHAPLTVVRMATLDGARFLGIDREAGSVEIGKRADLIVVDGDPSLRIADIENVDMVFKDGVAYDPTKLRDSVKGMVGWF